MGRSLTMLDRRLPLAERTNLVVLESDGQTIHRKANKMDGSILEYW
jgi:hypothetical protein